MHHNWEQPLAPLRSVWSRIRPLVWGGFIQRRLLFLVPQLIVVSMIAFVLIRLLPGNPAKQLVGPFASAAQVRALEDKLGLHEPLPTQYGKYVWHILHWD